MTTPKASAKPQQKSITFYVIAAPGVDPSSVKVLPDIEVLGWKFKDYDRGDLIDLCEQVDDQMSALETWLKAARDVLKATLPKPANPGEETVTAGKKFEAHYILSTRTDVDRDKVKAYFGDKYGDYCKSTPIYTLKIVPIVQTPGVAG